MHNNFSKPLNRVAKESGIIVLFACESGSRAWGFPSPDSDYDLRFIYKHDLPWYLNIGKSSDTIDQMLPGDLDIGGWELKKALNLFASCNLPLNEWLGSPIIYDESSSIRKDLKALIPQFFNGRKALHHYFSLANKTAEKELTDSAIKIKKLFYILRPIYACLWIFHSHSMPPTEFPKMLNTGLSESKVESRIFTIMKSKETAAEGEVITIDSEIDEWIHQQLENIEKNITNYPASQNNGSLESLNQLLFDEVVRKQECTAI